MKIALKIAFQSISLMFLKNILFQKFHYRIKTINRFGHSRKIIKIFVSKDSYSFNYLIS